MSRILIVEDELSIAEAVQLALSRAGHTCTTLPFGKLALEALGLEETLDETTAGASAMPPFDLLILDVGLPDLSGFDVCRAMRTRFSAAQLPVIFLTAHHEEIDRILGLELGGGDYLTKPFSLRELVARTRLLLGRNMGIPAHQAAHQAAHHAVHQTMRPAGSAGGEYSGFTWNEAEAWIRFEQATLTLTVTQYRLLLLLLGRPGQVFSRQQLLDATRGLTHPSGERTIDTHIKSLRAKLRAHSPRADVIVTHRGIGYSCQ